MCINTEYSMSIIEKVFHYEENEISLIKSKGEIWFRGRDIAKALGYSIPCKAICKHINPEDRSSLESLSKGGLKRTPLKNKHKSATFINESGLYSLILQSKLELAKAFKRWVTKEVLPSLRKTRTCFCNDMNHKYNEMLAFKIENEMDLHTKVISFLKKRYPHSIFRATLGENQDTIYKRINSFKKGYLCGSPDLIINNLHKHYSGFTIEMKSQNSRGIVSEDQYKMMRQYYLNGFKTLVSNDYDHIIKDILEYFEDVRMKCTFCPRKFFSYESINKHIKGFHERV